MFDGLSSAVLEDLAEPPSALSCCASFINERGMKGRQADLDTPVLTVHQTISDVRGSYYQEKTVFLRCTVNSNPPARFIWKRGNILIEQSKDNGVDIYEPLYTQGETKVLKLKNLRPKDFADYTCQVSVRNVCNIEDKSVTFRLTNATTSVGGSRWISTSISQ
ncbi:MAM domain-containing glycosylphosphatidylinositol anchor protein 1 [Takifugu flavidus]|uniref:MAM domain-containing glycosylphosphatidylinositol anchor protein 1 n=1 Tax=Takifugu flavidus TaxID=433684 RepID=A0A5C6NJU1_9TELE|nr:MAM domain-containing glycosylphosphatidylinositol anchor protein 1 [Takifugu flavidus]